MATIDISLARVDSEVNVPLEYYLKRERLPLRAAARRLFYPWISLTMAPMKVAASTPTEPRTTVQYNNVYSIVLSPPLRGLAPRLEKYY